MKYGSLEIHNPDKTFLIGDVHGDFDQLKKLWDKIELSFSNKDHLVFLGDLVNRDGLFSAEVLEFVFNLKNKYKNQIFVIEGNHDWMFKDFLINGNLYWMKSYGQNTLQSFKRKYNLPDTNNEEILDELKSNGVFSVLNEMIPYYETESFIATHAPLDWVTCSMYGLDKYENDFNDKDILNFKKHFLDRISYEIKWNFSAEGKNIDEIDKFLICGHQYAHHNQPRVFKKRAFIDTGCGAKKTGVLTALVFPGKKIIQSRP